MTRLALVAVVVLSFTLDACVGQEPDESQDPALRFGDVTCAHPEVGKLRVDGGFCTATLVSPTTVLTAAHCYDFESGAAPGTFTIARCDGTQSVHQTDWEISIPYSVAPPFGHADIAITRLTTPAPDDIVPASIATFDPYLTEDMTAFGFGCADWDDGGSGAKRTRTFQWGWPHWMSCEGDSGGPIFDSFDELSRLTSWGAPSEWVPLEDAYADPVRHRTEILAAIAALEGR